MRKLIKADIKNLSSHGRKSREKQREYLIEFAEPFCWSTARIRRLPAKLCLNLLLTEQFPVLLEKLISGVQ